MGTRINEGKRFELDFKKSVPDDIFYYRFRDPMPNFSGENTRFALSNICDCMLINQGVTLFLELKSVKGASIPLSNFRDNQIRDLKDAAKYEGIISGYLVNFRKYNRTWFMTSKQLEEFLEVYREAKKSIPVAYFDEYCQPVLVTKLRVNNRYDIKAFINGAIKPSTVRG